MSSQPAHLEPSELGTKEYWDNLYTTELSNNTADPSDIGTCWFDDSDAESRTLEFLASLADDGHDDTTLPSPLSRSTTSFLDLGCGNGSLLFALRDDGWEARMLGVDYSAQSIALARQISSSRSSADETATIQFQEWDLIHGPLVGADAPTSHGLFDVILDKGTFDAISLSDAKDPRGRRLCEAYRERMLHLLRPQGGIFLVTSCNWTEAELQAWFEGQELKVVGRVEYPTFTFGGAKGQTISTLCFRRE